MENADNYRPESVWISPKDDEKLRSELIKEFSMHPVTAQVLVSRNFETISQVHQYLYAQLHDLHDPHLLSGMDRAVNRVIKAIQEGETLLIYGDNDVDGITGTALLVDYLREVGADVHYYISNRSILRQSIFLDALEFAIQHECKLMITVDCGVTAAPEIKLFVEKGIDVIVTDHHEPTEEIPDCVATLNPKLFDSPYPNRELTGVGVAFKFVHALSLAPSSGKFDQNPEIDLKKYLDLVALGTVADMGVLLGENRILVRYGLQALQSTRRIGLLKLMKIAEIEEGEVRSYDISTKIAPRLNSLGRIDRDPMKGVELMLLEDEHEAALLADELDKSNKHRQVVERSVFQDVEKMIEENPALLNERALVLWSDNWHSGVIAIISARLVKMYNRPVAILAIDNRVAKGSLRTIREFPLLPPLNENADLLLNYGGHDYAAGLTLRQRDLEEFKRRFIAAANARLTDEVIQPKIAIDSEVLFSDLTYDFLESIQLLEPFGNENSAPILCCEVRQAWAPKVIGKSHLRMYLEKNDRIL
ncbi:MAG: single-stranded-DNA-specific exonuclease RecJ, partial [Chlamydiia bacterium]|nr:single-stranded-DNA-specific exonuclease RecJ [Chlamydiia bacterium]